MSRPGRLLAIALAVACAAVLTGCGDQRPTREQVREKRINDPVRRESVSASVGKMRLIAVRIETPVGSHAKGANSGLFLTLANSGDDDRLVAVSTVDAESVVQRDGSAEPEASIGVDVARNDAVSLQHANGLHLELVGLKREVLARTFVPVTFRFRDAGTVNVKVFVSGVDHPVVPPLPTTASSG